METLNMLIWVIWNCAIVAALLHQVVVVVSQVTTGLIVETADTQQPTADIMVVVVVVEIAVETEMIAAITRTVEIRLIFVAEMMMIATSMGVGRTGERIVEIVHTGTAAMTGMAGVVRGAVEGIARALLLLGMVVVDEAAVVKTAAAAEEEMDHIETELLLLTAAGWRRVVTAMICLQKCWLVSVVLRQRLVGTMAIDPHRTRGHYP